MATVTDQLENLSGRVVTEKQALREAELKANAAKVAAEQAEQAVIRAHAGDGNLAAAQKALTKAEQNDRDLDLARQGAVLRVEKADQERRQFHATNSEALLAELERTATSPGDKMAEGRRLILEGAAEWTALSQRVNDHLIAGGVQPAGNAPAEHELHEVARVLRGVGDQITSPMPHGRHQAFVEQNERVARAWKAERDLSPEAA